MEKIEVIGTDLHPHDRKYVLAAYVHRFTKQHTPSWTRTPRPCGNPYPVQFASDEEWLGNTFFTVCVSTGRLDLKTKHCRSTPTWPENPELRK